MQKVLHSLHNKHFFNNIYCFEFSLSIIFSSGFRLWHRRGLVFFFLVLCLFFYLAYSTEGTHQNVRFEQPFYYLLGLICFSSLLIFIADTAVSKG
jgi:hypothetical protein